MANLYNQTNYRKKYFVSNCLNTVFNAINCWWKSKRATIYYSLSAQSYVEMQQKMFRFCDLYLESVSFLYKITTICNCLFTSMYSFAGEWFCIYLSQL